MLERLADPVRGEITVVVEAARPRDRQRDVVDREAALERARELRRQGMSTGQAAKALASELEMSRAEAYRLIVGEERGD